MSPDTSVTVTGRGRTAASATRLIRPRTYEEVATAVRDRGARGGIARGLGRARGDAAGNAGGAVLDMTGLDRIHAIDVEGGTVLCDAGISLRRLTEVLLPLGWFPPVDPGAGHVTVGGALGVDAHGGDHHVSGSFSRHVPAFELLTADGRVRSVRPGTPLFDATAGGMGLTGVILTATLRLRPVETAWMTVDTERAADLDDLLARLTAPERTRDYSVARIDPLARGAATGRAVITRGDHAPQDALPGRERRRPLRSVARGARLAASVPGVPEGPLGRAGVALSPALRYHCARRAGRHRLRRLPVFFTPPDRKVPGGGGRGGLVRYRCVVGHGREDALRRIVRRVSEYRCPSFLATLRRFGEADSGWLSFPAPGWTLSLDAPASLPGLAGLLDALDDEVAEAGGRVDLAEDSRLRPESLARMYPRLDDFRALRAELDPRGVFVSDLSRRLAL
ncbi:FAD-binding oxidoreductase [Streptomyces sp. HSG2]|uniref:FAD-dependent oxidoreductase n=1 Tax=Streptomyces sp. HSG2 TaxID=2797167 RepID=UPI001906AEAD|nr:FAD-binding oxidoreductase [Streptomyces sp. HSG2]